MYLFCIIVVTSSVSCNSMVPSTALSRNAYCTYIHNTHTLIYIHSRGIPTATHTHTHTHTPAFYLVLFSKREGEKID